MNKIILIGGAPTTGKSTMAHQLSTRLHMPWISTDQIRRMLRSVARKEDYPKLFDAQNLTAEEFLTQYSVEEIVERKFAQAHDVWPGIYALTKDDYVWKNGFIIEGINIIPELVHKSFATNKKIHPLFLIDEDEDRMRDVVYTRGLWDGANTYSDDVKEKEVEWASLFGKK